MTRLRLPCIAPAGLPACATAPAQVAAVRSDGPVHDVIDRPGAR